MRRENKRQLLLDASRNASDATEASKPTAVSIERTSDAVMMSAKVAVKLSPFA
jgi:hypothetical protein